MSAGMQEQPTSVLGVHVALLDVQDECRHVWEQPANITLSSCMLPSCMTCLLAVLCWCCRQLVALLSNPHPVLASQALQVLILATHPSTYDWNPDHTDQAANSQQDVQHTSQVDSSNCDSSATSSGDGPHARSYAGSANAKCSPPAASNPAAAAAAAVHPAAGPDGDVWKELLQLQSGPLFRSLLRMSPDVFPESGFMAVQFLVFYLKWLRRWWTKVRTHKLNVRHQVCMQHPVSGFHIVVGGWHAHGQQGQEALRQQGRTLVLTH